jgi:hypothetical protein
MWQTTIEELFIDYNKNIMMIFNDYVTRFEHKLICKEIIIEESEHWKELILASKKVHVAEKVGRKILKCNWFDERAMKKKFNETWSTKC